MFPPKTRLIAAILPIQIYIQIISNTNLHTLYVSHNTNLCNLHVFNNTNLNSVISNNINNKYNITVHGLSHLWRYLLINCSVKVGDENYLGQF